MNVFAGVGAGGGPAGKEAVPAAGAGAGALLELTPHKLAVCHLVQVFAPPPQAGVSAPALPFPFESVAHHNRLGLFLFALTRSCNDFREPPLEELLRQLKAVDALVNGWLCEQLTSTLSALNSPDDLFNFFDKLRGVLSAPEGANVEDEFLDPNSQLGIFIRCCILSFNTMTFEGVCHLLANLVEYYSSTDDSYDLAEDEEFNSEIEMSNFMDANIHARDRIFDKYSQGYAPESHFGESSSSLVNVPASLHGFEEANIFKPDDNPTCLRSRWQLEAYLNQQADILEKDPSSVPLNSFNATMSQLQTLAPELHRVQFLQYLNALTHDDYVAALDNLHRYFDYSAGMQGFFSRTVSPFQDIIVGKYESALLCLGNLHCYFGHPKKALEAFTEAVRVSQMNNDDSCLAYILGAISNLLSKIGMSSTVGTIGSPYSLGNNIGLGTPLSIQQQLLVLLKRSLKRADTLKLTSLLSFDHLSLAKFDLKHVQRPLVSFGPNASTKLRTCPADVCKNLRLSSRVLTDFGTDGLSAANDNGSFSTSWLSNLSAASNSWCSSSTKSRKLLMNDFDNFHFHAQPSPIPASVLQLAGSAYLLRATAWEHYGSAPMVRMNSLVYATCFADAASSSDLSLAYVKLIQHLATFKGYSAAFSALKLAEEKFPSSANSHIQLLKMQLLHERALHRGHLKVAQQICDEFGVLSSSVSGVDIELKTEARLRHARTLLAAKQFNQAANVANSLFSTCYKYNMQVENASVLLLLAEIHKNSDNAVVGLPYALASQSFCKSFNLDLLEASATLTLTELWLALGSTHAKRALSLICQSLPMIHGHGGLELRARAHIVLAKCYLSDPKFSVSEDPSSVLDPLNQATEDLEVLEYHEMAAEAYYLKAMVYNNLGKLDEREEAAASFKEHTLALENPYNEEDSLAC
ncbi:anaphase-promoting complex subunit 5 isoform X1 [Oryza brachyantha]|uniref:Anaphase-promoting complex subunit 5 n=1 Tax=Oryza brachyantha TaxID=4533 RepID=J3LQV9_ORYBR|nr:anaphase-promoting complex subunit 5 isoform X1 [Oryza brachyantha]